MFDRMIVMGAVFTADELDALLTLLNDNPGIVVALRKRKVVMLVNAERIVVRKKPNVLQLLDSLELKNYLIKESETDTFLIFKFRPKEVKELHDLAIAVYAVSNLMSNIEQDIPKEPAIQNQTEPGKNGRKKEKSEQVTKTADKKQKKQEEKPKVSKKKTSKVR